MRNKTKKVFSLDEFWSQFANKKQRFDHKQPVVVSMNATFESLDESQVDVLPNHQEGMAKVVAKAYHDQTNLNGSRISADVFVDKTESIKLRPILANVVTKEDGSLDFGAHDFEVEVNEDGEMTVIYQEAPIGVISDYHFEYDTEAEVNRAVVEGYIFQEYNNAMDIINRRGSVDCSVELFIRDFHFDEDLNELFLDDYYVSGLTLLGAEHTPGMAGSNVTAYEQVNVKAITEDDQDGAAPSSKEKEPEEHVEPVKAEDPKPVAEAPAREEEPAEQSETTEESDTEEPDSVMEGEELTDEQKEELNVEDDTDSEDEDGVFILQSKLNEANKLLEEKDVQITTFQETIDSLNKSIEALNEQIVSLNEELKKFKEAEEEVYKDEVISDELYADYLETEEFKAIIDSRDTLSATEFESKLALAFAQLKRKENKRGIQGSKKLFNANKKPVSQLEQKYGKLFAAKRKEKN